MAVSRRRKTRFKIKKFLTLILLVLITTLFLNLDRFGKVLYSFPHRDIIFYYAQANQVDPYLIAAVIKTESNFDNKAVSAKGALGLMQLMPDTAEWIANQMGKNDFKTQDLYNEETNIALGSWYLANLHKEFKGDTILVLASYNGGRGNVKEWLESNHWNGEHNTLDQIPFPETRQFVRKVLWNYKMYNYLYDD
ncbi:Lytic transglycosylase catalytic [Desulfofarcimen acetoxidans DSM 771]|uniref:Lytic transglycosylase catalytic n=1 Tax=Desulfofarcimen acetoxidans (strain ATCC 49208 / DSM 771 / KCTC 5769 / VKM B-1644 / 5575) TaxID=485916 RepID=C8W0H5_DESAS|nr:lytic transglycosylase domain-containing protein [Desulfofarcimen acetoxidans]ACV63230.1 Lytic transglycosylase catalytic [Desulfofarcimen acetoxidans DSM 771]